MLWFGDDQYSYTRQAGTDIWLRYMDLTECVEFTGKMAQAALFTHLRHVADILALFDDVARCINDRHDLRGSDLATLIVTTYQTGGKLSSKHRERFADRLQTHVTVDCQAMCVVGFFVCRVGPEPGCYPCR